MAEVKAWQVVPSVFNNDKEKLLQITKEKGYNIQHQLLLCGSTFNPELMETLRAIRKCDFFGGVTKPDMWGNSWFHWAALTNSKWVVSAFLSLGVPLHKKNDMGLFPINVAIYMQNSEILQEFIRLGCAGDAANNNIDVTLDVPSRPSKESDQAEPNMTSQFDKVLVTLNPLAYMYMHGLQLNVLQEYSDKYRGIKTFVAGFGDIIFLPVHFDHADLLKFLLAQPQYKCLQKHGLNLMVNAHNSMHLLDYAKAVGSVGCIKVLSEIFDKSNDKNKTLGFDK